MVLLHIPNFLSILTKTMNVITKIKENIVMYCCQLMTKNNKERKYDSDSAKSRALPYGSSLIPTPGELIFRGTQFY